MATSSLLLFEDCADVPLGIAHRVIDTFRQPFIIDGQHVSIRASVGLAMVAVEDLDVAGDQLLKHADMAMYSAKRAATGAVHTYAADI